MMASSHEMITQRFYIHYMHKGMILENYLVPNLDPSSKNPT